MRLSFGNFKNGLIASVQQTLGHLGYPYVLHRCHVSMNLGGAIGSNIFCRGATKISLAIFLDRPD